MALLSAHMYIPSDTCENKPKTSQRALLGMILVYWSSNDSCKIVNVELDSTDFIVSWYNREENDVELY